MMPFTATWMDLEVLILNKISQRQRQKPYDITHMWNLKYYQNEHIYEIKKDLQTQRTALWLLMGGDKKTGSLGLADADYYAQVG